MRFASCVVVSVLLSSALAAGKDSSDSSECRIGDKQQPKPTCLSVITRHLDVSPADYRAARTAAANSAVDGGCKAWSRELDRRLLEPGGRGGDEAFHSHLLEVAAAHERSAKAITAPTLHYYCVHPANATHTASNAGTSMGTQHHGPPLPFHMQSHSTSRTHPQVLRRARHHPRSA